MFARVASGFAKRAAFWWSSIWTGWARVVVPIFAVIGIWDTVQGQLFPGDWQDKVGQLSSLMPGLPWFIWAILALLFLHVLTVEGSYRSSRGHERDNLIEVTPISVKGHVPLAHGDTASEVFAFLDVRTKSTAKPLEGCRVKLLDLHNYSAHTDMNQGKVIETWNRDYFYSGQTYFFSWSGRDKTVEAVDIHSQERAIVAGLRGSSSFQLATTSEAALHMYHGDQYHLFVEITAENSQPVLKEYWLQMHHGKSSVIEEWDHSKTSWL